MFRYYDKNNDDVLDTAELTDAESHEYLRSVLDTTSCHMRDFIILQDADDDAKLSLDELNTAMGTSNHRHSPPPSCSSMYTFRVLSVGLHYFDQLWICTTCCNSMLYDKSTTSRSSVAYPMLHCFDLVWISRTARCTRNPQTTANRSSPVRQIRCECNEA